MPCNRDVNISSSKKCWISNKTSELYKEKKSKGLFLGFMRYFDSVTYSV